MTRACADDRRAYMKITKNDSLSNVTAHKKPRNDAKRASEFDAILHNTMDAKRVSREARPHAIPVLNGPAMIDTASFLSTDKPRIIEETERMLDMLDEFQAKLADTRASLSDLSPIIEKMSREKDILMPFADSLPENDPLKEILNRALITCSVEIGKFERGDYL